MKAPAPSLLVAVPVAIIAAAMVDMGDWASLRPALLPALSIIAAAMLVRLARGLPFTNADHFTLQDFRSVARKLEDVALKLRTTLIVCLLAIASTVLFPDMFSALAARFVQYPESVRWTERTMSGFTGLTSVYAFVRIVEVVQIDVALLKLQARILEGAIAAKNAKAFEDEMKESPPPGIAGSTSFGRQLQ